MPSAANTPSSVMWSGITRAGSRCASQSSTRPSWRASRNVFSRGASDISGLLVDRRLTRSTPLSRRRYGIGSGRRRAQASEHADAADDQEQPEQHAQQADGERERQERAGDRGRHARDADREALARRERALAAVLQRADDHGRDRRHQRDALGEHLARAQREDHHRDRDRAAADAEQPGQEAAVEPEERAAAGSWATSSASVVRCPAPKPSGIDQPQAEDAGDDRERDPQRALGDAGVDARAEHARRRGCRRRRPRSPPARRRRPAPPRR